MVGGVTVGLIGAYLRMPYAPPQRSASAVKRSYRSPKLGRQGRARPFTDRVTHDFWRLLSSHRFRVLRHIMGQLQRNRWHPYTQIRAGDRHGTEERLGVRVAARGLWSGIVAV